MKKVVVTACRNTKKATLYSDRISDGRNSVSRAALRYVYDNVYDNPSLRPSCMVPGHIADSRMGKYRRWNFRITPAVEIGCYRFNKAEGKKVLNWILNY